MVKQRSQTLRIKTLERDNFTCQKCKLEDKTGKLLEAHHINLLNQEGMDELANLITLCKDCHHFAPNNQKEFLEYIQEEMTGTATNLVKAIEKVRKEQPGLFKEQKLS